MRPELLWEAETQEEESDEQGAIHLDKGRQYYEQQHLPSINSCHFFSRVAPGF